MPNPWITHLKQVRQANPHLSYKECMVKGKQSYTKKQKGGSVYVSRDIPKNLSRMKPLTNAQIAQLGMGIGDTVGSLWNVIKNW